jgi:hypothetical protein
MPIMRSLGETADEAFGKSGALTHCQDDVEVRERLSCVVLGTESVSKKRKLRTSGESRPVGAASRHALPIIDDRNFHEFFLRDVRILPRLDREDRVSPRSGVYASQHVRNR